MQAATAEWDENQFPHRLQFIQIGDRDIIDMQDPADASEKLDIVRAFDDDQYTGLRSFGVVRGLRMERVRLGMSR